MSTSDRKAELERKKAKLQAMRDEKKRKEEEKRKRELGEKAQVERGGADSGATSISDLRAETDQILQDIGISPTATATSQAKAATPPVFTPPSKESGKAPEPAPAPPVQAIGHQRVQLSASKITQTSIPPRELVTYSKETQTHGEAIDREDDDTDSMDVAVDTPPVSAHSHKMPHVSMARPSETDDDVAPEPEPEKPVIQELTDEEKNKIQNSDDYIMFMEKSLKIIERVLTEEDVFVDYTGADSEDKEGIRAEGEKLKLDRQFFDERWSKHRVVMSMDWSTQFPELLACSYNNNEDAPHDPDGVVLVWNTKYKTDTPEFIFHCQSRVLSCCFAKFQPNLIIGGTYSGQIVLWDNRSPKRTPVQRTPLSAAAHTHPVYCLNMVGTQNAHNLISISTDGKMCSWGLDMLSQPQDNMELQSKQSKAVAVTCFSFLSGNVNNFVVGSEETNAYTACRHGSRAGINEIFEGHKFPITGIDCHTVQGQIDFSQYFLTSSFDWTVKLWSTREQKYLHSFEDNSDNIYDVKWSPTHPALFSSVDGTGRLDLWNLNNDTEIPTASTIVDGCPALNKCLWHQNGHQIAVGDDAGRTHIYDVGENLATPRNDEWSRFVHTLQDLKMDQAEQDEAALLPYR